EALHPLFDARANRPQAMRAFRLALDQLVARGLGGVSIAHGERLKELREPLRLRAEELLDSGGLGRDLLAEAPDLGIGVPGEASLGHLSDLREGERPRSKSGLDPLANVARVLRGGDVV